MVDGAECVDHRIDQHEQRGGHQQRKLHTAKERPARRPFQRSGFGKRRRDALQRRQIEDHEEAGFLPDRHEGDGGKRRVGRAEPVVRGKVERAGDLFEQAVLRRVEEQPDVGDRDHRQHGRGEVGHADERAPGDAVVDPERHQDRERDRERDGAGREQEIVPE